MVFRAIFGKIKQAWPRRATLFTGVASLFRLKGRVDKEFLDELEKRLYLADVGTAATTEIVDAVRQAFLDKEITGDVEDVRQAAAQGPADAPEERDPLRGRGADRGDGRRRQRLGQDDLHRQAGQAIARTTARR